MFTITRSPIRTSPGPAGSTTRSGRAAGREAVARANADGITRPPFRRRAPALARWGAGRIAAGCCRRSHVPGRRGAARLIPIEVVRARGATTDRLSLGTTREATRMTGARGQVHRVLLGVFGPSLRR